MLCTVIESQENSTIGKSNVLTFPQTVWSNRKYFHQKWVSHHDYVLQMSGKADLSWKFQVKEEVHDQFSMKHEWLLLLVSQTMYDFYALTHSKDIFKLSIHFWTLTILYFHKIHAENHKTYNFPVRISRLWPSELRIFFTAIQISISIHTFITF